MGISRSATLIVAHLMHKYGITRAEALSQIREGRPICEPNLGFMKQLEIHEQMLQASGSVEAESIYQRWLSDQSLNDGQAVRPAEL
jgi:dual specificity phosphatase 12